MGALRIMILALFLFPLPAFSSFEDGVLAYKKGDYLSAYQYFKPLADKGDARAKNFIGVLYFEGKGLKQDHKQAVIWFQQAAELGNMGAQFNLANMYDRGIGVSQDHKSALYWYKKAADQGDAAAMRSIGAMYQNGEGVVKSEKDAFDWYSMAAALGDAKAQLYLGALYANGRDVPVDDEKAAYWVSKAAAQGDPEAEYNYGRLLYYGVGVPQKDYEASARWYRKAAMQGNTKSMIALAKMYENELSQSANDDTRARHREQSLYWYARAIEKGDKSSINDFIGVARAYRDRMKEEASDMLLKLASDGNDSAQLVLGGKYMNGWGVKADDAKAYSWYRKAAELGNEYAQFNVGWFLFEGRGTRKNIGEAMTWLKKSADAGFFDESTRIAERIGDMYATGNDLKKDKGEAVKWYKISARWRVTDQIFAKIDNLTKPNITLPADDNSIDRDSSLPTVNDVMSVIASAYRHLGFTRTGYDTVSRSMGGLEIFGMPALEFTINITDLDCSREKGGIVCSYALSERGKGDGLWGEYVRYINKPETTLHTDRFIKSNGSFISKDVEQRFIAYAASRSSSDDNPMAALDAYNKELQEKRNCKLFGTSMGSNPCY